MHLSLAWKLRGHVVLQEDSPEIRVTARHRECILSGTLRAMDEQTISLPDQRRSPPFDIWSLRERAEVGVGIRSGNPQPFGEGPWSKREGGKVRRSHCLAVRAKSALSETF